MMILITTLAATLAMMLVLWLVSLKIKNASIVDIFWGAGFAVIALVTFTLTDGYAPRKMLITGLAVIWGLRLATHIGWRNHGKGEDFRYQAMRKRNGNRFALVSLYMAKFKAGPANKGRVMDRGLWAYTRHPNYFGDALLWWGFFLIASATPRGWWTVISPVLMTTLLMKVSGVALLEKTLVKTRPEYQGYVRRTSAFFPLPPKR